MGSMPPSEPATLEELAHRLAQAGPDEQATLAPQALQILLDDDILWGDLSTDIVTQLLSLLDEPNPTTRSAGVFVAGHVALYGDEYVDDRFDVAVSVFDALEDESPMVRQTAANSRRLDRIVEEAFDDSERYPISLDRIATLLFDLLHDPDPVVRRRIGQVVRSHGADLISVHPDPTTAGETLVGTFGDSLDGYCIYTRPVAAPRHAALMTLDQGFEDYDASFLAAHTDSIAELLHDSRRRVRSWAARLLDTLVPAGIVSVEDIADDVITAARRNYPKAPGTQFPRLALRVALVREDAVEPVYDHLRRRYTAANTSTDRWKADDPDLIALSRLVRAADRSFDPPAKTLAAIIGRDTSATEKTDPLVLLAPDHPEFVADQLRQGYRLLVDGEIDHSARFYTDLVVAVADRNPAAIEGVPEILAENLPRSEVRKTMTALVAAYPDLVAHLVPAAYARAAWEPPLRYQHSQLIEKTAEHWETVPDTLTSTLVETVGTGPSEKRRRFAIRALVALDEAEPSVLPERFRPFVDLYDRGAFHDDDDPVDPLETDAAEVAGLR